MSAKSNSRNANGNVDAAKAVETGSNMIAGFLQEFSFSGVAGLACGVAARRLTSDALYGAGMCIAGLQMLAYKKFITINWKVISDTFTQAVDQDGNGKLDASDIKIFAKRLIAFLSNGLPDATGFGTGFFLGFKYFAV